MLVFDATTFLTERSSGTPPRLGPKRTINAASTPSLVHWSHDGVPPLSPRARGQKLVGIKYEQRVADVLSAIYGDRFERSPMIRYAIRDSQHRAIPDGILRLDGPEGPSLLIVEVKLSHTDLVWEQLHRYLALVSILEPRIRIRIVEICRSYDPGVLLPGPHTVIDSLHKPAKSGLEVLIWKI